MLEKILVQVVPGSVPGPCGKLWVVNKQKKLHCRLFINIIYEAVLVTSVEKIHCPQHAPQSPGGTNLYTPAPIVLLKQYSSILRTYTVERIFSLYEYQVRSIIFTVTSRRVFYSTCLESTLSCRYHKYNLQGDIQYQVILLLASRQVLEPLYPVYDPVDSTTGTRVPCTTVVLLVP
jgi:hypothetical protein